MPSLADFPHAPGRNCLSAAVRDVLDHAGLRLDEDHCFGISGAFNLWYSRSDSYLQVTGLGHDIFDRFCAVTGFQHHVASFDDDDEAEREAFAYLAAGLPVIVETELASYVTDIDTIAATAAVAQQVHRELASIDFRVGGHVTVLVGHDGADVLTAENLFRRITRVPRTSLRRARNPRGLALVPPRNRLHVLLPPSRLPERRVLVRDGLRLAARNMLHGYPRPPYCTGGVTYEASGLLAVDRFLADVAEILARPDAAGLRRLRALVQVTNRWGGSEVNRQPLGRFLAAVADQEPTGGLGELARRYAGLAAAWRSYLRTLERQLARDEPDGSALAALGERIRTDEEDAARRLATIAEQL